MNDRDFGKLEATVESLEKRLDDMGKKIDSLLEMANKSKGGLWAGLTISSFVGGFVTWVVTHFPFKGFGA